jgi:hypothetical protein
MSISKFFEDEDDGPMVHQINKTVIAALAGLLASTIAKHVYDALLERSNQEDETTDQEA